METQASRRLEIIQEGWGELEEGYLERGKRNGKARNF